MSKFKKALVITGSARSGTSWFSETLSQPRGYRLLFEPEQDHHVPEGILLTDKYFHQDTDNQEANDYLIRLFNNRVDNDWIAQNSFRKFKMHLWPFLAKKHIIKFVRFNLSSHYIAYKFKVPVIFILRNPYEVISSQMRVSFSWLYDLSKFQNQDILVDLILKKFNFNIRNNYSPLQKLAIRWCIENIIPLKHEYPPNLLLIRYEEIVHDIELFKEVCKKFMIEYPANLSKIYKRPSSKAHPRGAFRSKVEKDKKSLFNKDEFDELNDIFEIFKMDIYPISNSLD